MSEKNHLTLEKLAESLMPYIDEYMCPRCGGLLNHEGKSVAPFDKLLKIELDSNLPDDVVVLESNGKIKVIKIENLDTEGPDDDKKENRTIPKRHTK